jgi:ornithine cyclodeaminase
MIAEVATPGQYHGNVQCSIVPMMSEALPYVGRHTIEALGIAIAADALEATLADGLDPECQPRRSAVQVGGGELLVMPGVALGHAALKAITVGSGDPRIQGVCVVFDGETLAPIAVLDGPALTVLRTAAVSAVAVRHLAAADARRLLVFGNGPQGHAHVAAMRAVLPIEEVRVLGRGELDADAVARADVICCCTTATEPLFDGGLVADHACVVAIGSHDPRARETDDRLAARATVVVESREVALREAGDVIAAVDSGALAEDELVTLSELIAGAAVPALGPRLFKSVGMGWQDAVVAAVVLKTVPAERVGQ